MSRRLRAVTHALRYGEETEGEGNGMWEGRVCWIRLLRIKLIYSFVSPSS